MVDEDDGAWDAACEALIRTGARIMRARASGEALMTLVGTTPDVALVDVDLHGTTALALVQRLRALETAKGGRIPVATVSAGALPDADAKRYRDAGAQTHLTKPFDGEELVSTVTRLCGLQVDRRAGRKPRPPMRRDLRLTGD